MLIILIIIVGMTQTAHITVILRPINHKHHAGIGNAISGCRSGALKRYYHPGIVGTCGEDQALSGLYYFNI